MLVSVVVCTWNRANDLAVALSSLAELVIPPAVTWELLVVDNNSSDSTGAVVARMSKVLPVRLLKEARIGKSYACNTAISAARGELMFWTDDDVSVDRLWLVALFRAFDEYTADVVFGRAVPIWPGEPPTWYCDRLRGNFALLDYGSSPFLVTSDEYPFNGLNYGARTEALRSVGGFREDVGLFGNRGAGIGEDVDLFHRMLAAGMRIVYVPDAVVGHRIALERLKKGYHRRRRLVAVPGYYDWLTEVMADMPWLLGLPRFLYRQAAKDVLGYLRDLVRMKPGERFFHELQLLRFARLAVEAGRHGFRRPPRTIRAGSGEPHGR